MLIRIVKIVVAEDEQETFKQFFNQSKFKIMEFKGCQSVQLLCGENRNQHVILFTLSYWDNETALDNYRASDFFQETWQKAKTFFKDKPEAWSTYPMN